MEAVSSVQHKDKMADGSGSPYGRGTKTMFLCEVIGLMLSPKKQETSIA